jgi:hypothetical protein
VRRQDPTKISWLWSKFSANPTSKIKNLLQNYFSQNQFFQKSYQNPQIWTFQRAYTCWGGKPSQISSRWHSHSLNTYKCAVMIILWCEKFQIEFFKLIPNTRIHTFVPYKKIRFFYYSERFYKSIVMCF